MKPEDQRPEAPYVTGLPPVLMTDLERQLTARLAEVTAERDHKAGEIDKLLKTLAVADVLVEQARQKDAVVAAARALMQAAVKGDLLLVSTSNGNIYTELQADLAVALKALDATEPFRNVLHQHQSGAHAAPDEAERH